MRKPLRLAALALSLGTFRLASLAAAGPSQSTASSGSHGSAGQVSVRIVTDPPGASLVSPDGHTVLSSFPLTKTYTTPTPWTACMTVPGFGARWPSGAEMRVGRLEVCPRDGPQQHIQVSLPETSVASPPQPLKFAGALVVCRDGAVTYKPANGRCGAADQPVPAQTPTRVATSRGSGMSLGPTTVAVTVLRRQFNEAEYSFVVPGSVDTYRTSRANCVSDTRGSVFATAFGKTVTGTLNATTNTNCSGSATANSIVTPARTVTYRVRGAVLSLQLPDRRVAVVNCDSKANWIGWTIKRMGYVVEVITSLPSGLPTREGAGEAVPRTDMRDMGQDLALSHPFMQIGDAIAKVGQMVQSGGHGC